MSVVLLPLTLIASIFGMNVPVPGQEQEFAFLGILLMMGVLLLALVALLPAARLAVGERDRRRAAQAGRSRSAGPT